MGDDEWTSIRVRKSTAERLSEMLLKNYDIAIVNMLEDKAVRSTQVDFDAMQEKQDEKYLRRLRPLFAAGKTRADAKEVMQHGYSGVIADGIGDVVDTLWDRLEKEGSE